MLANVGFESPKAIDRNTRSKTKDPPTSRTLVQRPNMLINESESEVEVSLKLTGQPSADRVFDTSNRIFRVSTLSKGRTHLLTMRHIFSWMQHKTEERY